MACSKCKRDDKKFRKFEKYVTETYETNRVICPECSYLLLTQYFENIAKRGEKRCGTKKLLDKRSK